MKKIIVYLASVLLIGFSETNAAGWDNLIYGEVSSLYRVGMEASPELTTSHFAVATAPKEDAILAQYDVIFSHAAKTVSIRCVGKGHSGQVRHISMIKLWFDNAPDSWKEYEWCGLIQ